MATVELASLLDRNPGIRGGRLKIAGTGITVLRIARCYKAGMTPEIIVSEYPHLSIAQVYAALAYYLSNRTEMDEEMEAEQIEAYRLEREYQAAVQRKAG